MRPHPDDEVLALHALGEPAMTAEDAGHVASCETCRSTVASFTRAVVLARGPEADDPPAVDVPARVWQAISDELDIDPAVRPRTVGPRPVRAPLAEERPLDPGTAASHAAGTDELDRARASRTGGRRTGRRRTARRRTATWVAGLAAAGLAVAGAAGVVTALQPEPETVPLASAELDAFGEGLGTGVHGSARLVDGGSGGRVLEVWLDDVPDTGDDFLEAWLIDATTGQMVSLGPVSDRDGGAATVELAVPEGVDVSSYDLVDVSAEPLDGDPTHSGASLVRGSLGA